jgi:RNA polymerase sigma factor (sigma-70 family)
MLRRRDPLANPEPLIRRVYSYAAYRLGDGPDAEDVTSQTLERALRYRRTYDSKAGSPQAWVLGIARRVVDDHLARETTVHVMDGGDELAGGGDLATGVLDRLSLREALTCLSQAERDLIALRYGADLAVKDIARATGARTNTIEVGLHRALRKLREQMEAGSLTEETKHERA